MSECESECVHCVCKLRSSFLFLNIKCIYLPTIFYVFLLSALSKYLVLSFSLKCM